MKVLKFIGAGWAILGAGNILLMSTKTASDGVLLFGLIFNMVLFVLPGLAVYGIGKNGEQKIASATKPKKNKPIARDEIINWIKLLVFVFVGIFLSVLLMGKCSQAMRDRSVTDTASFMNHAE